MAKAPPPAKNLSRKGAPPPPDRTVSNLEKPEPEALTPLNFKVPNAFKREFKMYATARGMSMVDLLQQGFEFTKERLGA